MELNRRGFLRWTAAASAAGAVSAIAGEIADPATSLGVLVDIPNCIGCRKCEFACLEADGANPPTIDSFDDRSVFATKRRLDDRHLTVLNQHPNPRDASRPIFVKSNCLHCNDPACVSACLVGALRKEENGSVSYDAWKCMGCRYCMIACPFQIPTYEYGNALTPRVRKCSFCFDRISQAGNLPACVKICPRESLTFGRRGELLELAHRRIAEHPSDYIDHVYGEHEAGGTAWMYLSGVPFESLGFASPTSRPPQQMTEAIQHGIFRGWFPPIALYGLLWMIARLNSKRGLPSPHLRPQGAHEPSDQSPDGNGRFHSEIQPGTRRRSDSAPVGLGEEGL